MAVEDTGAGIAQSELARVFERFHRIPGVRARTHEGTGIGLALVQELVRLHGGSISVASEWGRGSRFSVKVPRGKRHFPAEQIPTEQILDSTATGARPYVEEALRWLPEDSEKWELQTETAAPPSQKYPADLPVESGPGATAGQLLVADDNADMREYLRRVLSKRYEVHLVPDGEAAWVFVQSHPVDLVLTDIMMPRMDGFELLRRLRADPVTKTIPVILLSARAGEESRIEGLNSGADDCLVKPFTVGELLARVDVHLRLARIRREATELIRDREGRIVRRFGTNTDVSEQRRIEEMLRESESRLRAIGDNLPEGAIYRYRHELNGTRQIEFISAGIEQLTGVPAAEFTADPSTADRNILPEDLDRLNAAIALSRERLTRFEVEVRRKHRVTGEIRWSLMRSMPSRGPDGSTVWDGIELDITERKRAEEKLRASERRYSTLFANKINAMAHCRIVTEANGRPVDYEVLEVNQAYERVTGIRKADIEGKLIRQVFPGIENASFDYIGSFGKVALEDGELSVEVFFESLRQRLSIYAYSPTYGEFVAMFTDV